MAEPVRNVGEAVPRARVRPERVPAVADYDATYYCGACKEDTWVQAKNAIKCWKCNTVVMYKKETRMDASLIPEEVFPTPEVLGEAADGVPEITVEVPVAYLDATYVCAACGEENSVNVAIDGTLLRAKCWKCDGTVLYKKRTGRVMEYQAR